MAVMILKELFHLLVAILCVWGWLRVMRLGAMNKRWKGETRELLNRALWAEKKRDHYMWELVEIERALMDELYGPRDWSGETAITSSAANVKNSVKLIRQKEKQAADRRREAEGW